MSKQSNKKRPRRARRKLHKGRYRTEHDSSRVLHVDADGGRLLQLDDEQMDAIKSQLAAFEKKFGRKPGDGDPVFFDPDEDTPVPMKEGSMWKHMSAALDVLESEYPAWVYACRQTERIVMEDARRFLTREQLDEFDGHMEAYDAMTCQPDDLDDLDLGDMDKEDQS